MDNHPHIPSRGILCLCTTCQLAQLEAYRRFREDMDHRKFHDPYLDGDYDLIDSHRRFEYGE